MINKEELLIVKKKNKYRIAIRQPFLKFFKRWVELTCKEEDNVNRPIEFDTHEDAICFVETVSECTRLCTWGESWRC